jgi:hypothetical protein
VHQSPKGYAVDKGYYEQRSHLQPAQIERWSRSIQSFVQALGFHEEIHLETVEYKNQKYEQNESDVIHPDYRLAMTFKDSIINKKQTVDRITEIQRRLLDPNLADREKQALYQLGVSDEVLEDILNLDITDDSNINNHSIFLTPHRTNKTAATFRVVRELLQAVNTRLEMEGSKDRVSNENVELIIIGDGFLDFKRGVYAGPALNMKTTYIIPDDSRLIDMVTDPEIKSFAGNSVDAIKRNLHKDAESRYTFKVPGLNHAPVTIIVGEKGRDFREVTAHYLGVQLPTSV